MYKEFVCPKCNDDDYNGKHCFECGYSKDNHPYEEFDEVNLWDMDNGTDDDNED